MGLRIVVLIFRGLIVSTLRMRMTPRARAFLDSGPTSSLFLVWHNRGLCALCGFGRYGKKIPLTGLVSVSGDGALMAEAMMGFGLPSVRGSSSKRAAEAARELIGVLNSGRNIVITPDGPRGPVYTIKEGTVVLGREHARAVYLLAFKCSRSWRFNSWDKYIVPKPFSRLDFDVEKVEMTADVTATTLAEKLSALNNAMG